MPTQSRAPSALPREVVPDVHWIGGCLHIDHRGTTIHGHVSSFVLVGDEATLMVDTGHPKDWPQISAMLDQILPDRGLDLIFPTHPELPHAGNVSRLLEKYPDATVCGDVRDYHLFYPDLVDRFTAWPIGHEEDLGGLEFVVMPAVVRDLPNSQWGYERTHGILFVADAFGFAHHHGEGECAMLAEEMTRLPDESMVRFVTNAALYWTRFREVQSSIDTIAALRQSFPTRIIAPAHGNVITDPDGVTAAAILRGFSCPE